MIGVGQRLVGGCWWAVEVRLVLGSVLGGVSLGAGQSLLLERGSVRSCQEMLCLLGFLPELRDKLEKNFKRETSWKEEIIS